MVLVIFVLFFATPLSLPLNVIFIFAITKKMKFRFITIQFDQKFANKIIKKQVKGGIFREISSRDFYPGIWIFSDMGSQIPISYGDFFAEIENFSNTRILIIMMRKFLKSRDLKKYFLIEIFETYLESFLNFKNSPPSQQRNYIFQRSLKNCKIIYWPDFGQRLVKMNRET